LASYAINPGKPFEELFAGTDVDMVMLADTVDIATVLTEALPDGSLRTRILSVDATFAAVGNSETLLPVLAMIHQLCSNGQSCI